MVGRSIGLLVGSGCLSGVVVLLLHLSVRGVLIDAPLGWALACGVGGVVGVVRWSRRVRALADSEWWQGRAIITRSRRWGPVRVNVLDPVDWSRQRTRLFINRPIGIGGVHWRGKAKTMIWVGGRGSAMTAVLGSGGQSPVVIAVRPDDASRIGAGLLRRAGALVLARRHRLGGAGLVVCGFVPTAAMAVFANFVPPEDGDDPTWQDWVMVGLFVLSLVLFTAGFVSLLRWHRQVRKLARYR